MSHIFTAISPTYAYTTPCYPFYSIARSLTQSRFLPLCWTICSPLVLVVWIGTILLPSLNWLIGLGLIGAGLVSLCLQVIHDLHPLEIEFTEMNMSMKAVQERLELNVANKLDD